MNETPETLNAAGTALMDSGDFQGAIDAFERALALAPGTYAITWNLARALHLKGNRKMALALLNNVTEHNDADADAWVLAGLILWEEGDIAGAEKRYRKATALDPNSGDAWNDWGVLDFNRGRIREAKEKFERAALLKPASADVWINLRDSFGELGDTEKRGECVKKLESLGVHDA